MFSKILIANRGEIACRVMATARRLGIRTVAVYSDADKDALHVNTADEAIHIGGPAPADSYLRQAAIIEAALKSGAEAIHPGYGFLSENPAFSRLCLENNLVFIGPPTPAIEIMGSKSAAKRQMEAAGVPLLSGYHGDDQDPARLKQAAAEIGYPVLLKAVAGGGGKGMRQVSSANDFYEALEAARREATSGFGDDAMLVEKYLEKPRHVEVQVFCDSLGHGVYLFERDCSVQRRHQKIIEEAPAPGLSPALRVAMGEAALRAAKAVDYVGAGTVEFLLDDSHDFYFMEMNTRLQVEHPVTEMITGKDLVEWQLIVATGEPLPCHQEELAIHGHAFEARIYAEDPDNDFLPATGKLVFLQQPATSTHVRVDTGVVQGDEVGVYYDPMIAKLIVWDVNRDRARQRLSQALADYGVVGVTTNIPLLRRLIYHPGFADADISTDFIARHSDALFSTRNLPHPDLIWLACLYLIQRRTMTAAPASTDPTSPWNLTDHWRVNAPAVFNETLTIAGEELIVQVARVAADQYLMTHNDQSCVISGELQGNELIAVIDGHRRRAACAADDSGITLFADGESLVFTAWQPDPGEAAPESGGGFTAPMHGTIVEVLVETGASVKAGDTLIIMEAMKMEHAIKAPSAGVIREVFFTKGDLVDGGSELLAFEPET